MNKVLLVMEEYTEMTQLESILKKIGFNVVGISSEFALSQQILSFNPDFVIASGATGKVTAVGVSKRLREMPRWLGHTVLCFPAGTKPSPQDLLKMRVDSTLESPVHVEKVIALLARETGQDEAVLIEKMKKQAAVEDHGTGPHSGLGMGSHDDNVMVSGGGFQKQDRWELNPAEAQTSESSFSGPDMLSLQSELETLVDPSKPTASSPLDPSGPTKLKDPARTVEPAKSPTFEITPEKSEELSESSAKRWAETIEKANQRAHSQLEKGRKPAPHLAKESTLHRKDTKKAQKELTKDWKEHELKNQDLLRQEFTRSLFKKK